MKHSVSQSESVVVPLAGWKGVVTDNLMRNPNPDFTFKNKLTTCLINIKDEQNRIIPAQEIFDIFSQEKVSENHLVTRHHFGGKDERNGPSNSVHKRERF